MSKSRSSRGRRIAIVHPGTPRMRGGNRVTALRWASVLRELGWRPFVERDWSGRPCEALVALHAAKTLASIRRFRDEHPRLPRIVACAGTDLYRDGGPEAAALEGLALADRIVVFQENALADLPPELRERARVIHQSVRLPEGVAAPAPARHASGAFQVAVIANLRAVKDPLSVARAARLLPPSSRIEVCHAGAVLEPELGRAAREEERGNPRYRHLGELEHGAALALLAASQLLVVPSRHEGGANVVSEALALGIPCLATRIPGSTGLLGEDHPGLYPVGDADALASLLQRCEDDAAFLGELRESSRRRAFVAERAREVAAWGELLGEVAAGACPGETPGETPGDRPGDRPHGS